MAQVNIIFFHINFNIYLIKMVHYKPLVCFFYADIFKGLFS